MGRNFELFNQNLFRFMQQFNETISNTYNLKLKETFVLNKYLKGSNLIIIFIVHTEIVYVKVSSKNKGLYLHHWLLIGVTGE